MLGAVEGPVDLDTTTILDGSRNLLLKEFESLGLGVIQEQRVT